MVMVARSAFHYGSEFDQNGEVPYNTHAGPLLFLVFCSLESSPLSSLVTGSLV
jgi:hypothetical protein